MTPDQFATLTIGFAALVTLAAIAWAWVWASEAYHRRGVAKHRAAHPELFGEYESTATTYRPHHHEDES